MLNINFSSSFKKDSFSIYTNISYFSFFLNIYKYTILNLVMIFRFSQISKSYFVVYSGFFLPFVNLKKKKTIFSSDYVNNNDIQNYINIFSAFNTTKKNILIAVALKKKANLFKKYDSYKRSVFFNSYSSIKDEYLLNNKKQKYFYSFKSSTVHVNSSGTILNSEKSFKCKSNEFLQSNYQFFRKFFFKNKLISAPCFLHKKRLLYRMHRRFNTRYYANRLIAKHVFLPEKSKQFSITRFIENFKTHSTQNFYNQIQLFLFSTLLSCQFFFFKTDCFFFLKQYGVFVNGKICTNPYKILVQGDVIQLPVISTYFFFFKKFDGVSSIFFKKYNAKFQKMFASKKKRFRTKSRHLPKWVNRLPYLYDDVPSYLEVDYTIMSAIVVYNSNSLFDVHTAVSDYILLYLYRTYNWRKLV